MEVDKSEFSLYLGCKNKNVYCYSIDKILKDENLNKPEKSIPTHNTEITTMSLNKNEKYLIVGTSDGTIYKWSLCEELKDEHLEVHKGNGPINNIVPMTKPL